jgi:outer membrane receptor for ferrienterochelin and colicins
VITKDPQQNSFNLSANSFSINGEAADNTINANVNALNGNRNAGISIFASHRDRQAWDANGDGFSEMPKLLNNSFGFNAYLKFDAKNRLDINGWSINEERRGGNKIDEQADKADQSEYRLHNILTGGFNYDHIFRENKSWISIYGAAQNTKRTHYTGIDHADAWGRTRNHSVQGGIQYNYVAEHFIGGRNTFTAGAEQQYEYTYDEIKAYNYLVDQEVQLLGMFLQSDWDITKKLTLLSGIRINHSNRVSRLVGTPRLSLLYKAGTNTQLRASYARGFKAPQAFETDMHIAFAGGGVSLIKVNPALKEETSDSYNFSVDFNKANETLIYGFTGDVFYTRIANSFILQELGTDGNGNQQLLRTNGAGATVQGITLEARINYSQLVQLESGITLQDSRYDAPVYWSAGAAGSEKFLRTPGSYGFYTLSFFPKRKFSGSLSGVYSGPMDVPHFAGAPGVTEDHVKVSPAFFEQNIKLSYRFTMKSIGQDIQLSAGVQNIFNQYQNDFDTGKNRDSNYIYGPSRPRTFFVGLKFGVF